MSSKHHILLLGGTGLCGQLFTRAALESGHTITIYARTPAKLPSDLRSHQNLTIIEGTFESEEGLSKAASCGADTFISFAGPTLGRFQGTPVTNALKILYPLLLKKNPHIRILLLSTASYSAPQDQWSIKWFLGINAFVRPIGGDSYTEIKGMADETVGLGEEVEWTVFRVPLLRGTELYDPDAKKGVDEDEGEIKSNEERAGVNAVFVGDKGWKDGLFLDRGRLVTWILGELEERKWVRLAPMLTNADSWI